MSERKRIKVGMVLVIGAVISYAFAWWLNVPTKQSVQLESQATTLPATTTYKSLETKYFRTKVNQEYRVRKSENPRNPNLVQIILFDTSGSGQQVGITTNRLPAEGLNGVSDYNYRTTAQDIYEPLQFEGMPPGAQAFKNTKGAEISLFMTNDSRYASITASGTSTSYEQLLALVQTITAHWEWMP